jgi:NAD(P)-dependent dehydrogenase (short-subunit alcohol dehydrogenase family)
VTVAFVTGGGRGVGRVIAEALAAEGLAVCVVARTATEVEETAAAIDSSGGRAIGLSVDATDRVAVEGAVAEAEERLGPIEVLVNNAGRAHAVGPVWEVDPDDWWQDVEVNVRSAFLCARATLPGMLERDAGRILNVSSYVALRPTPYISGYAAGKAAILSVTESLAASVAGTGVRVFALTPGLFRSELMRHLMESEAGKQWLPGIGEGGRWVEPERVARLVVFLATGAGDAFHGRFLHALDDLDELVSRADEIARDDLFTPRLRR